MKSTKVTRDSQAMGRRKGEEGPGRLHQGICVAKGHVGQKLQGGEELGKSEWEDWAQVPADNSSSGHKTTASQGGGLLMLCLRCHPEASGTPVQSVWQAERTRGREWGGDQAALLACPQWPLLFIQERAFRATLAHLRQATQFAYGAEGGGVGASRASLNF